MSTYKYLLVALFVIVGCIWYYYIDPSLYVFTPKCPVKQLTGWDCPGCGFQRALHASLHGHFIEAIHYNLFLLLAIPLTCLWILNGIIIQQTNSPQNKIRLMNLNRTIIYLYIFFYFSWFVIRNFK